MKNLMRSLLALSLLFASQALAKAEEILLQSAQSGLYVTVINGTLAAAVPDARGATRFETVRLEGNRVAFRDVRSGSFVRAGVGQGTFLATGSPHIRGWETFEVVRIRLDKVALRSVENGRYVRAGVGPRGHLAAVSGHASAWEHFRFVNPADAGRGNAQAGSNQGNNQGGHQGGRPVAANLFGNYFITHIAADNGFLVRVGGRMAARAQLSVDESGTVRATVGCNSMSARLSIRNDRVRAEGGVMSTKMRCSGQGESAAERGIANALMTSRSIHRQGRTVTFKDASGAELMKIERR
ncbi:MAG: META domain-containing protein [Hoeflea sp.]|uniref:META domain-containing protein n=1 Tax=Hoeflea sp. TaxID=1940281 RepID=UPI001DE8C5A3|nr:META domain-containing protein [Hoeflea sp.]MBU4527922.1 META domain-containing protein [Alphaproteobacteria bacterium]MBU4546043.1 META domain-containing protein [Alphaproteobacteria bacterium]MBU4553272.1 META domain-containing protein [Alphaproteobacteria bacterium]MBV1724346.1 META domain-containing protein [Hoeflea sp.]MBV1763342.1 META domain-containing protein [Hoeflea sp.]